MRTFKSIIANYLIKRKKIFKDKIVIDMPAGSGTTSQLIKEYGGIPIPLDLFPEYFKVDGLVCTKCDIKQGLNLKNNYADVFVCQEGIEHFSDQLFALKEFNRILKKNGILIITTPNYSNLRSKLSYLLSESERFNSLMPPNEIDSVWMTNFNNDDNDIYLGHIFLIGVQKLRVLAKLAGFKISNIEFTELKSTSLFLLILFYPFILFSNYYTYRKNIKKETNIKDEEKRKVYKEIFKLSINPKILVDGSLLIEFEKEYELSELHKKIKSIYKDFNITT